jgi:hypothetical protein
MRNGQASVSMMLKKAASKAATNYHFIRGGWDDPNCARPTRASSSRALREHGDRPSYPAPFSASCYTWNWASYSRA